MLLSLEFKFFVLCIALSLGLLIPWKCKVLTLSVYMYDISTSMVRAVLHAAQGPLSLVTFSTMLSMLALLEAASPLGGSMRPW